LAGTLNSMSNEHSLRNKTVRVKLSKGANVGSFGAQTVSLAQEPLVRYRWRPTRWKNLARGLPASTDSTPLNVEDAEPAEDLAGPHYQLLLNLLSNRMADALHIHDEQGRPSSRTMPKNYVNDPTFLVEFLRDQLASLDSPMESSPMRTESDEPTLNSAGSHASESVLSHIKVCGTLCAS